MNTEQGVEISGSAESQSAEPSCNGDMLSTGTTGIKKSKTDRPEKWLQYVPE